VEVDNESTVEAAAKELCRMSEISSIGPGSNGSISPLNRLAALSGVQPAVGKATALVEPAASNPAAADADRVELSDFARFLDLLRQLPEVRQERIDQLRQAIADGSYETDEKIDVAIERLVDEEIQWASEGPVAKPA